MRIVVGLGNPGPRYARTWHNAGFLVVDRVARALGVRFRTAGVLESARGEAHGVPLVLGKPATFMNLSGEAVSPLCRRHGASPEDLVVVHDDLDLPLGEVRLKRGGGTGGHNGLRSVRDAVGTSGFLRVRVGIGRPPPGTDPADFVLSPVPPQDREAFGAAVEAAAEAVLEILRDGFDRAMTRRNARRKAPPVGEARLLAPGGDDRGLDQPKGGQKDR